LLDRYYKPELMEERYLEEAHEFHAAHEVHVAHEAHVVHEVHVGHEFETKYFILYFDDLYVDI